MTPQEMVLILFTVLNAFQIVSYIPQIVCVARDRHGATSISYSTWSIWAAGTAVTTVYALVNIWDLWLAAVNAVHTICCLAVIALTAVKRSRLAIRVSRDASPGADMGQTAHAATPAPRSAP